MMSPIGLLIVVLKPQAILDLTIVIFGFQSQKSPYLYEKVEMTLLLTASLISTVYLQSVVNCDDANVSLQVKQTCLERGIDHLIVQHWHTHLAFCWFGDFDRVVTQNI